MVLIRERLATGAIPKNRCSAIGQFATLGCCLRDERIFDVFNNRVLVNMTPDSRARKLAIVSTLAGTEKDKVRSSPFNNLRALRFKRRDGECEQGMARQRGHSVGARRDSNKDVQACREDIRRANSVPMEIHASQKDEPDLEKSCLELDLSSNLLTMPSASFTNLLEEIEAGLPTSYSLANVLDHTPHTVTNLRTWARLSRVGMNCAQVEENVKKVENPESDRVNKIKNLQREAFIQKTLIEQADKAVSLCKARKRNLDAEDLESVRVLLMAKLRYEAINLELQKVTYSGGEEPREEYTGELRISDVWFTVNNAENHENNHFVCIAQHKETLLASCVQSQIVDGKLHFPVNFKFDDLRQHFTVHLELYRLNSNVKTKKERTMMLDVKSLIKAATSKTYKNAIKGEQRDFECVGSGSVRLSDIRCREKGKVSVDFHCGYQSPFGKTAFLNLRTRLVLNETTHGFLDLFKGRCWHRLWCCPTEYALRFWCYPEDKDNEKAPVETVLLPHCREDVQPVSMDVCIRPHSFMITYKKSEKGILLSASSQKDMVKWIGYLRSTIRAFEAWTPDF